MTSNESPAFRPMRIQARRGSRAERNYYAYGGLPAADAPIPEAMAPGIQPSAADDLIFHGGKIVPQMEFQNIFLGSEQSWLEKEVRLIDAAITRAMQDRRLNSVMAQYFSKGSLSCEHRDFIYSGGPKPMRLDEPQVQAKVIELFDAGRLGASDLSTTLFNLVLPRGTVLTLDDSSSLDGLGGYHGSVHFERGGKQLTLYYSANVFSERLSASLHNGIAVFDEDWKNVVATLYHELNEFRTDADVGDAIRTGNHAFLGWMSRRGHECGDQPLLAAQSLQQVFVEVSAGKPAKRTPVQLMFSNEDHGASLPEEVPTQ